MIKIPKKWLISGLSAVLGLGTVGGFTLIHMQNSGTQAKNCLLSYCPTTTPEKNFNTAKSKDIPTFMAIPESNGNWVVVGEIDGKKRPLIRTIDPNWGKEYPRDIRAKMIASKLNQYFQSTPTPIALTTGSKNGFSILCVSESISGGCLKDKDLGQIMTFGRKANPVVDKDDLIAMIEDNGKQTRPGRVIASAPRVYIDIRLFLRGESNPLVVGK
jgi:hypothetical protein